jgi:O-antigen ligase
MQSTLKIIIRLAEIVVSAFILPLSFFLFFILGDTYLRWYLLPLYILGLFLVFIRFHKFFPKNVALIPIWLLFLIWTVVSAIFSHALSLSLDFMLFQTTLFLTFSTVVTFRSFLQSQENEILIFGEKFEHLVALFFILIGVVLSILSFGFVINPDLALKLPGFNILHASYGHNHLASYLILILPLSWWITLKNRSFLMFVCTVFMTISLLTSFGRVAVTIGFVQLLFLSWLYFKSTIAQSLQLSKALRSKLKISFLFFVSLFLAVLVAKSYFSLISVVFPDAPEFIACPIPQLEKQLCKPLGSESRVYYWNQALGAIFNYPFFGYGPGTFGLISSKYALIPSQWSGFAHNSYLQITAELGIIGGVLFLLKKVILVASILAVARNKKDQLFIASIAIGLISLFSNNLFDFDWNFIGVAVTAVCMASLAISVKDTRLRKNIFLSEDISKDFLRIVPKIPSVVRYHKHAVFVIFLVIFMTTSVVFYTDLLFSQNKFKQVLSFFPYVSHHSVGLVKYPDWTKEELDQLFTVYQYQPMPLESLLADKKEYPDWLRAYGYFHTAQRGVSQTNMLLPNWANHYLPLHERIDQYDQIFDEAHELAKLHQDYNWFANKKQLLENYLMLANQVYSDGDLQKAAEMYLRAFSHDQWVLSSASFAFLQDESQVQVQNRGEAEYVQTLAAKVESSPELLLFLREIVPVVDTQLGYNATVFAEVYLKVLQSELDKCMSQEMLCSQFGSDTFLADKRNILSISPWNVERVWEISSESYLSTLEKNKESLSLQQKELVLSHWFEDWQFVNDINTTEWQIGHPYTNDFARIGVSSILEYAEKNIRISEFEYETKLSQETITYFKSILKKIQILFPEDYAIQPQLGNFYVMIGDLESAQKSYQKCLEDYAESTQQIHYACEAGLDNSRGPDPWKGRFIEASREIISEKS